MATTIMENPNEIYRVHKTLVGLLRHRGYNVNAVQPRVCDLTLDQFKEAFCDVSTGQCIRGKLSFVAKSNINESEIGIWFLSPVKVGVAPIKEISVLMEARKLKRAIVIVQEQLSPFGKAAIAALKSTAGASIEVFFERELKFDITSHSMVPKHEVLSDVEKKQLLKNYKLKETQLPRIKMTDPIARYYGLSRGQVVRIYRNSDTAGKYITYRICMPT